jgi:hypothetical protein
MMSQKDQREKIERLFRKLERQGKTLFPGLGLPLRAPTAPGIYVIRDARERVLHVGRTPRGVGGLRQRLRNHLYGQSSFARKYLKGKGGKLRNACTFQCLEVPDARERALLEHLAIGVLCPLHLGTASES